MCRCYKSHSLHHSARYKECTNETNSHYQIWQKVAVIQHRVTERKVPWPSTTLFLRGFPQFLQRIRGKVTKIGLRSFYLRTHYSIIGVMFRATGQRRSMKYKFIKKIRGITPAFTLKKTLPPSQFHPIGEFLLLIKLLYDRSSKLKKKCLSH
jgi:hypothetical protein